MSAERAARSRLSEALSYTAHRTNLLLPWRQPVVLQDFERLAQPVGEAGREQGDYSSAVRPASEQFLLKDDTAR